MRHAMKLLAPAIFLCGPALGQSASGKAEFEAADVHVSPPGSTESGDFLPNGRIEFRATTLLRLITLAHSVSADRVAGGPSWLDTDRFDVVAKAPTAASQIAMRNMLKTLLADRFGLVIKQEDKPVPVFALVLAKRGVAKESSGTGDPDCKGSVEENVRTLACQHITIAGLAERLPGMAGGYFNLPVVDRTGLTAAYDFRFQFLPRGQLPPGAEGAAMSLFNVIEKQIGVKVEKSTEPMPVLTVEHVNRTPSENPPGTMEKVGSAPTEFEVATLRPSRPDEQPDANVNAGRIDARALTLRDLISFAYDVEDDWVRGGDKWLDTDRYDITAKTVPTASIDTLRVMLQALLAERFKLKVHKESQPVTVYALTVVRSKLKDADPSERSTCRTAAADGARTYTCWNTTMAQFAEKIRQVGGGYLEHPAVDLTGLKGSYDFTLSWTPRGRLMGGRGGGGAAEAGAAAAAPAGPVAPTASERAAGFTLFEAVERQLGLKLSSQKHPMPVVVIDHVDRTPTEN
jgi:uncharacterized protein (TIGR03435 family)